MASPIRTPTRRPTSGSSSLSDRSSRTATHATSGTVRTTTIHIKANGDEGGGCDVEMRLRVHIQTQSAGTILSLFRGDRYTYLSSKITPLDTAYQPISPASPSFDPARNGIQLLPPVKSALRVSAEEDDDVFPDHFRLQISFDLQASPQATGVSEVKGKRRQSLSSRPEALYEVVMYLWMAFPVPLPNRPYALSLEVPRSLQNLLIVDLAHIAAGDIWEVQSLPPLTNQTSTGPRTQGGFEATSHLSVRWARLSRDASIQFKTSALCESISSQHTYTITHRSNDHVIAHFEFQALCKGIHCPSACMKPALTLVPDCLGSQISWLRNDKRWDFKRVEGATVMDIPEQDVIQPRPKRRPLPSLLSAGTSILRASISAVTNGAEDTEYSFENPSARLASTAGASERASPSPEPSPYSKMNGMYEPTQLLLLQLLPTDHVDSQIRLAFSGVIVLRSPPNILGRVPLPVFRFPGAEVHSSVVYLRSECGPIVVSSADLSSPETLIPPALGEVSGQLSSTPWDVNSSDANLCSPDTIVLMLGDALRQQEESRHRSRTPTTTSPTKSRPATTSSPAPVPVPRTLSAPAVSGRLPPAAQQPTPHPTPPQSEASIDVPPELVTSSNHAQESTSYTHESPGSLLPSVRQTMHISSMEIKVILHLPSRTRKASMTMTDSDTLRYSVLLSTPWPSSLQSKSSVPGKLQLLVACGASQETDNWESATLSVIACHVGGRDAQVRRIHKQESVDSLAVEERIEIEPSHEQGDGQLELLYEVIHGYRDGRHTSAPLALNIALPRFDFSVTRLKVSFVKPKDWKLDINAPSDWIQTSPEEFLRLVTPPLYDCYASVTCSKSRSRQRETPPWAWAMMTVLLLSLIMSTVLGSVGNARAAGQEALSSRQPSPSSGWPAYRGDADAYEEAHLSMDVNAIKWEEEEDTPTTKSTPEGPVFDDRIHSPPLGAPSFDREHDYASQPIRPKPQSLTSPNLQTHILDSFKSAVQALLEGSQGSLGFLNKFLRYIFGSD